MAGDGGSISGRQEGAIKLVKRAKNLLACEGQGEREGGQVDRRTGKDNSGADRGAQQPHATVTPMVTGLPTPPKQRAEYSPILRPAPS